VEKGAGKKKRTRLLTLCLYCGVKFRDNFNMKTHAGGCAEACKKKASYRRRGNKKVSR
jgi:hypothetical protein